MLIPYFQNPITAGFPSPADDFIDNAIDLNRTLIKHPAATFFVKAEGGMLAHLGIFHNSTLVVDRALSARNNDVVVAVLEGNFVVRQYRIRNGQHYLVDTSSAVELHDNIDYELWGVVSYVIHKP